MGIRSLICGLSFAALVTMGMAAPTVAHAGGVKIQIHSHFGHDYGYDYYGHRHHHGLHYGYRYYYAPRGSYYGHPYYRYYGRKHHYGHRQHRKFGHRHHRHPRADRHFRKHDRHALRRLRNGAPSQHRIRGR